MDPDTNLHEGAVLPGARAELALDLDRRLDGRRPALEHREELVRARIDLAAVRARHGGAEDASDGVQDGAVLVAEFAEQGGGGLDVRHEQGDESGGQRRGIRRGRRNLTLETVVLDDEAHRCQHRFRQRRIIENPSIVHERRRRPALALEVRHGPLILGRGKRDRLSRAVQVCARRVGPVQDRERRISQNRSQPFLELARSRIATELDDQATGGRVALLGLQLSRDEPDGHDAVLLRRVEQPCASALPRGVVLERHLVEPRERIAHVCPVVHGQPSPALRVDVGEGRVRKAIALLALEPGHR